MDDILAAFRKQILYALAWLGALLLLPFALNNFLQGRTLLGIGTLTICLILFRDAWALHRRRPLPIRLLWLFPPVIGSLAVAIPHLGVAAVLWSYPAMILFYFVLNRLEATLMNLALVVVVGGSAWSSLGWLLTIRIVSTLLLTGLFCHIFLGIIASLQSKLQLQTVTDPLTGAFNRREMDRGLEQARERAARTGAPVSLLAIDLDFFKRINDELGHDAGDETLKSVVSLFKGRLRKLDQLYRAGGEEFLVLLDNCDRSGALIVAEALRVRVAGQPILPGRKVTVSVGVAELRGDESRCQWLKRADLCLYRAKQLGRDRVFAEFS